jgi:hypothetical protein
MDIAGDLASLGLPPGHGNHAALPRFGAALFPWKEIPDANLRFGIHLEVIEIGKQMLRAD